MTHHPIYTYHQRREFAVYVAGNVSPASVAAIAADYAAQHRIKGAQAFADAVLAATEGHLDETRRVGTMRIQEVGT